MAMQGRGAVLSTDKLLCLVNLFTPALTTWWGEATLQKLPAVWYPSEHLVSLGYKAYVYWMHNNIACVFDSTPKMNKKGCREKEMKGDEEDVGERRKISRKKMTAVSL